MSVSSVKRGWAFIHLSSNTTSEQIVIIVIIIVVVQIIAALDLDGRRLLTLRRDLLQHLDKLLFRDLWNTQNGVKRSHAYPQAPDT